MCKLKDYSFHWEKKPISKKKKSEPVQDLMIQESQVKVEQVFLTFVLPASLGFL